MEYIPLPWQIPVWKSKSPIVLLAGAAGGGKSRIAAEKVHGYLCKYPGATGLVVRKTLSSMLNSTLLFFENEIIGTKSGVIHRRSDKRFVYPNGSILAYGGMHTEQQREGIRGVGLRGGLDIVWMEEATQFQESDFNELLPRMRGKAAPWRQVLLATNPDGPMHWINLRLILGGEAELFESKASDNTYNPEDYQATLNRTTGVEFKRLVKGQWARSGKLVYEMWADGGDDSHVSDDADYIPGAGPIYWGVDDGYAGEFDDRSGMFKAGSHPRVFLLGQMRGGRLYIFDESYRIKTKAARQISGVMGLGYPEPELGFVDKSAASLKGEMHDGAWGDRKWQIYTRNGPARVDDSMQEVREWLNKDDEGLYRVYVHPRCRYLRSEMLTYGINQETGRPIKDFDHGPDALRNMVWNLRIVG